MMMRGLNGCGMGVGPFLHANRFCRFCGFQTLQKGKLWREKSKVFQNMKFLILKTI